MHPPLRTPHHSSKSLRCGQHCRKSLRGCQHCSKSLKCGQHCTHPLPWAPTVMHSVWRGSTGTLARRAAGAAEASPGAVQPSAPAAASLGALPRSSGAEAQQSRREANHVERSQEGTPPPPEDTGVLPRRVRRCRVCRLRRRRRGRQRCCRAAAWGDPACLPSHSVSLSAATWCSQRAATTQHGGRQVACQWAPARLMPGVRRMPSLDET